MTEQPDATTSDAPSLKPCPFCGKDDAVCTEESCGIGEESWTVGCGCTALICSWSTKSEAITAWNTRATDAPSHSELADRSFMLAAARSWWAENMPNSRAEDVVIKGDGRIDVHWRDADESGKYTLPVNFLAALRHRPGPEPSGMREALEAAIRAANLALFVIRKQGIMPNSSWQRGFEQDMALAEAALASTSPTGDET